MGAPAEPVSPPPGAPDDLLAALARHWGYASFRPRQERIVRSLLAGRDVAVVMPTGGGKSLCYQLPALIAGGTAVVVSPLLSLMRDQIGQLTQIGIPAAAVNSQATAAEQGRIQQAATQGDYRLLYISPERLAREDTMAWLRRLPLSFFVIDEAHCISEWGHEFRPEYRELRRLRETFPGIPIAAFTASATQRVRRDILSQLHLRAPDCHILSFHRPNLRYLVRECQERWQTGLLLQVLRGLGEGNAIVYAPTIKLVLRTAAMLQQAGIDCVPYHGRMENGERNRNQERWMRDEVRVLVGTVAFGLGVNKATTRLVVHLALPKSIEQYYQEAGRAGRDGLNADCLLLWQRRDAGLLAHFANQVEDDAERERCWQRYHAIRRFVEEPACRHRQICLHFGEVPKWERCECCDVCLGWPAELELRKTAVKSARSAKPRRPPAASKRVGVPEQANAAPLEQPLTAGEQALFERLRDWRRAAATAAGWPAYTILTDTTLRALARQRPQSEAELLSVPGIGPTKLERHGPALLEQLAAFTTATKAGA